MGYSPFYFIGQTFKNMWRNRGLGIASVLILMACLLVTGAFYAVNENINYNLDSLSQLNKLIAWVDESYADDEVRQLKASVEKMDNVASVTLISKEQALQEEKEKYGEEYSEIFEFLGQEDNPYRASLEIEYKDTATVGALEEQLRGTPGVDTVVSRSVTASKVERVKEVISRVFVGLMILLFVVSVFVIVTAIRLALLARSQEITAMRYVGATGLFISVPFLLEGALLGLIAALASFGVQNYVYTVLASGASEHLFGLVELVPISSMNGVLLPGFLLIGLLTGLFGSILSMIRYLRV